MGDDRLIFFILFGFGAGLSLSFFQFPMRKFRQAIESEGEAFRMSEPAGWRACGQRL
jgi:hypothetical protein